MANGTIMEVISSETAILYQFVPVYVVCIMNFMPKEHEVTKFRTDVALREKSSEKGMDENTIMEITGLTQEGNQKVDIIDMIKKFPHRGFLKPDGGISFICYF